MRDDRIVHRQGWIAKRSMEIPLENINDVRFNQSIFERMIGAGDLIIESAGTHGQEVFGDIRRPEHVQKVIYEETEKNQQRMSGGHGSAMGGGPVSIADELAKELKTHVRSVVGPLATPDELEFVPSLPKTRSGKIMRRLLREIAASGAVAGDTTTLEDFSVLEKLRVQEEE